MNKEHGLNLNKNAVQKLLHYVTLVLSLKSVFQSVH